MSANHFGYDVSIFVGYSVTTLMFSKSVDPFGLTFGAVQRSQPGFVQLLFEFPWRCKLILFHLTLTQITGRLMPSLADVVIRL